MAHALVTGATGFIGSQLVDLLLERGATVTCLVRQSSNSELLVRQGVRLSYGDVREPASLPAAVADADVVYHLAGLTKAHSRDEYCKVNEAGVRNLLEACAARTNPPTVIHVSSLAAAGPTADGRLRTEADPATPVANYGLSKRDGELVAESFASKLPVTVVRPPVVLGPRDVTSAALFRSIKRIRSFAVLGKGRIVSAVYVRDLANGIILAAEKGERLLPCCVAPSSAGASATENGSNGHGYYFFAADESPTFSQFMRMVARSINRPYALAVRIPFAALWTMGAFGEAIGRAFRRPVYLNLDRVREITAGHWACSAAKAKAQLGFAPAAPLADRINETAKWYRENGWL
jgi:nucleoside-diphosphate-sugar epimerase